MFARTSGGGFSKNFEAHAKRETCYALARRINLLGCVKNGPSDLSTNREHFEGFGKQ